MRGFRCVAAGLALLLGLGCSESFTPATADLVAVSIDGPFPGTTSVAFTVTGANFGQIISDQATVAFTAAGGTPFQGGTAATVEVTGTIVSDTAIEGMTPAAVIAGPASLSAEVRVTLPSGAQFGVGSVTFLPPTVEDLEGTGVFPAAIPTAFTINGANFGPVNASVTIHLTSQDPLFGNTTEIDVPGTIASATTITATSPLAAVCGPPSALATLDRITFPDGSTTPDGTAVEITFEAPTVASLANTAAGSPHETTAFFAAAIPESFTLTGTGFGPIGGTAQVEFRATTAIFGTGVATTVPGTILSDTVIEGTSPEAAVCDGALADVEVSVRLPDGACTPAPVAGALLAPTLVSLANLDRGGTAFLAALPEAFRITGTDFGPVGGTATVRFEADTTAPFGGLTFVEVPATIVDRSTLEGTSPPATLCPPLPGSAGSNSSSDTAQVSVTLPGGSCAPAPLATTIEGPAITSLNAPSTPPVDVPSTVLLDETTAEGFTLEGTGFGPVGGTATVTFTDAGGGTPFDGETSVTANGTITDENTITGTLPTITDPRLTADVVARVTVALPNDSCAFFNELANFVAPPTITEVTNLRAPFDPDDPAALLDTTWLACVATPTEIEGTAFAAGATHLVFDEDTGAAIGTGVLAGATTTATLIAGLSPTDTTLDAAVTVQVRVVNPDQQFHESDDLTYETTGALPNVNATKRLGTEAEMHMSLNPTDPLNVVICSHDGGSGFRQVRHSFTKDGGVTWTSVAVGPPGSASDDGAGAGAFRFDPMSARDAFGNLYIIYGASAGGVVTIFVHQSRDGGSTFASVTALPFPASGGLDRWTAATGPDPSRPGNQALYVGLIDFRTLDILVAGMSVAPDGTVDATYASVAVNDAAPGAGRFFQHGTPSVGPGGELYVSYTDAAANFTDPTRILIDLDEDGLGGATSTFGTDRLVATTDMRGFRTSVTPMPRRGYVCIPMHQVIPTGPFTGRVVMTYTDAADPFASDMDVVTRFSDDKGLTWSDATLVHAVDDRHQFHPWMDVDPVRGDLYLTYYDTKNDALNNRAVERFAVASADGGETWGTALLLSQGQSDAQTTGGNEYLEYNGVAAWEGCVYACWADNANVTADNPGGTQVAEQFDVLTAVFMLDPDG
ncbi:MAG: hypothetical protein ACYTEZ_14540 [Planctomycetota bacterium]|jgi:hypothetical protein